MNGVILGEVVSEIAMTPGSWSVIEAAVTEHPRLVEAIRDELRFTEELDSAATHTNLDLPNLSLLQVLEGADKRDVVLLSLDTSAVQRHAEALDERRNRFVGGPTVILLVEPGGKGELARMAPNLDSWIGSNVWSDPTELPSFDTEQRLRSIREHMKQSDEDVLKAAEARQLPMDPVYAEWLALLGRGDLLGP